MNFLLDNLAWVLIIVLAVFVGGGWFLFSTGMIFRIMDWLSPTSDKHLPAKMFCEDKQIRDRREKIGKYVISDDKKHRSFYLIHNLLLTAAEGHRRFLALSERSAIPIDFHGKFTCDMQSQYPSARRVFLDTTADIRSESSVEGAQNFMAQSLSIIALAAAVVVIVFFVIVFFQTRGGA